MRYAKMKIWPETEKKQQLIETVSEETQSWTYYTDILNDL